MKKFAIASVMLLAGCESQVGLNVDSRSETSVKPPSNYTFRTVAHSVQEHANNPIVLIEVANKNTGKVHLIAYHDGQQAESMVKLEEWTEAPTDAK